MSWREPFDLAGDRLRAIRAKYGKHALGVYYGNQAAHNLGLMLFGIPLFRSLGTRNVFAATSVDQLPQMLAAYLMSATRATAGAGHRSHRPVRLHRREPAGIQRQPDDAPRRTCAGGSRRCASGEAAWWSSIRGALRPPPSPSTSLSVQARMP